MAVSHAIFVYGTLRRGECRSNRWPRIPLRVEMATTRGRLFHLGGYPGLIAGTHLVRGELWHFAATDMNVTLAALDRVEGFRQGGLDLYRRETVTCQTEDGRQWDAYAYFYARWNPQCPPAEILPGPDGVCDWLNRHNLRGASGD